VSLDPEKLTVSEFATLLGLDAQAIKSPIQCRASPSKEFLTIPQLAARWVCSRGSVYNYLRDAGAKIVDFAPPGGKGKKLVPMDVVERIERQRTKRIS
jgi:hypothetical protein